MIVWPLEAPCDLVSPRPASSDRLRRVLAKSDYHSFVPVNPSNLLGLDYRTEANRFQKLPYGIVDAHAHVNGTRATALLRDAMDLYGIETIWSMTALEQIPAIRQILGKRLRLIAVLDFASKDRRAAHGSQFLDRITAYHAEGAHWVKFWAAPRITDFAIEYGDPELFRLDAPQRIEAMTLAASLGMGFMTHVADPDTWFATRYSNASVYGTKQSHYRPLERLLDQFPVLWIAAHMGGWPEDLEFLTGLLDRHPNLHLDTSATKWMIRELSKHDPGSMIAFLERFTGRIIFGSDIVTTDDHLTVATGKTEMGAKANTPTDAFDLYASRYWALRTLWETNHDGPSPIADPDLAMVAPDRHQPMDAPRLRGLSLPPHLLKSLYTDAASTLESKAAARWTHSAKTPAKA